MIVAIGLAVAAVLLIGAAARLRLPALAAGGLFVLALAEGLAILLLSGSGRELAAVPAAALLLLAGEIGFDLADGVTADAPGAGRDRTTWLGATALTAAAVAFVVLGADTIGLRRSAVATIAGAAVAAAAVWLLVHAVHGRVVEE